MTSSYVQTILNAEQDAVDLSEFMYKPSSYIVSTRLGGNIHTLKYYISLLNSQTTAAQAQIAGIEQTVQDAINNTAVEGGVIADTFVTGTAHRNRPARTQREINLNTIHIRDFIQDGLDDSEILQEALRYCADASNLAIWNEVEGLGTWGGRVVLDMSGYVCEVTRPITLTEKHQNIVIESGSIKAVGDEWELTDFIFQPAGGNATYVTFENMAINCDHKCGGIHAKARNRFRNCYIECVGGIGILADGSDVWIDNCIIGQWVLQQSEFYDENNYTGIGIKTVYPDARITGCTIRWLKECVRIASTNILISDTHMFNGMEFFANNGATGRSYHPLVVVEKVPNQFNSVKLNNCYLDNGTIELYDDHTHFTDCQFASNANHSNAADDYWVKVYAYLDNQQPNVVIDNPAVWVQSIVKKLIIFDDYNGSWNPEFNSLSNSKFFKADRKNSRSSIASQHRVLAYGDTYNAQEIVHSSDTSRTAYFDKNTTLPPRIGSEGDDLIMEADSGVIRLKSTAIPNADSVHNFGSYTNRIHNIYANRLALREDTIPPEPEADVAKIFIDGNKNVKIKFSDGTVKFLTPQPQPQPE